MFQCITGTSCYLCVIFQFVRCDGCKLDPIGGYLYHCKECEDFDYCEDCFKEKVDHKHGFTKSKVPGGIEREEAGKPRRFISRIKIMCGLYYSTMTLPSI